MYQNMLLEVSFSIRKVMEKEFTSLRKKIICSQSFLLYTSFAVYT